jgi:hypothetical protein
VKFNRPARCSAIIQPGEFLIDVWDNKPCNLDGSLHKCEHCDKYFCNLYHWWPHVDEVAKEISETDEENA